MQKLKQKNIHTWLASGAQSLQNSKFHQVWKVFVFGVHSPGGKPDLTIWVYIFHCSFYPLVWLLVYLILEILMCWSQGSILDSSGGPKWCRQIHPIILFNFQKCLSFESHLARVADKGSWIWPRTKKAQPSFQGYRLNKDFTRMPLKTSQVYLASSAFDSFLGFLTYRLLHVSCYGCSCLCPLRHFMRIVVPNGPKSCTRILSQDRKRYVVCLSFKAANFITLWLLRPEQNAFPIQLSYKAQLWVGN